MNNLYKIRKIKTHRDLENIKKEIFDICENSMLLTIDQIYGKIKQRINETDYDIEFKTNNNKIEILLKPRLVCEHIITNIEIKPTIY